MNDTTQTHATEAPAVGAPVDRHVRPVGWLVDGGYFYGDIKSAFWRANKQDAPPPQEVFTRAQLDAAVAAERERWRTLLADVNKQTRHNDYDWPACLQQEVDEALKA